MLGEGQYPESLVASLEQTDEKEHPLRHYGNQGEGEIEPIKEEGPTCLPNFQTSRFL